MPGRGEDDPSFVRNALPAMVGDVNLFLSDEEDDAGEDGGIADEISADAIEPGQKQGELSVMIAREDRRGKGMGTEASLLMMLYGAEKLGLRRFFVKIGEDNVASRSMFEKALGFRQCGYVKCFREVELELRGETADEMAVTLRSLMKEELVEWKCSV